jgi:hypothetical protein
VHEAEESGMKKLVAFLLTVIILSGALISCATSQSGEAYDPNSSLITEDVASAEKSAASCVTHDYELTDTVHARALAEGSRIYSCKNCGATKSEPIPATGKISVLAIGNSFTQDSMEFLWQLCNAAEGIESVKLGYLFIGGSSLQNDMINIHSGAKSYTYYKNTTGTWETSQSSIALALEDDDWEIVVLRNYGVSLFTESNVWLRLDGIVDFIRQKEPQAQLYWHATWAYEQEHLDENYADTVKDQAQAYAAIVEMVQKKIVARGDFEAIIPCVSSVQNMRTSYLASSMTRDGYHLSFDIGRYVAGLTWFCTVTGASPEATDWVPESSSYIKLHLPVIREAVANALKYPFEITKSSYPTY